MRGNPNISKYAKGRPKGSGNKTPILMQELEKVIFELPKAERMQRLRDYRDHASDKFKIADENGVVKEHLVYRNYVNMHIQVAKRQEENGGQGDLFDYSEEEKLIAEAEAQAGESLN